jgi:hypothetical protein
LAIGQHPFTCDEIECCRFNQSVRAGDCNCHTKHSRNHREAVRAILAKVQS